MTTELATSPPLTLSGNGWEISLTDNAQETKQELILASKNEVVKVDSEESSELAHSHLRKLGSFRIAVRKTREMITQPLVAKQKEVIRLVDTFLDGLEKEEDRVKALQGEWVRRQEAEKTRLLMEAARAQVEAEEAQRLAEEKRQQELFATIKASQQEDPMQFAKANLEAGKRAAEAAAKEQEESQKKLEARMLELQAEQKSTRSGKMVYDYELENIHTLYAERPHLVEIFEKRRDVMYEIETQNQKGLDPKIPGLRIYQRPKISSR